MEEADKDWMMIRMVGEWMFLLVPAHMGSPGQRAIKRLLLLFHPILKESVISPLLKKSILDKDQLWSLWSLWHSGAIQIRLLLLLLL